MLLTMFALSPPALAHTAAPEAAAAHRTENREESSEGKGKGARGHGKGKDKGGKDKGGKDKGGKDKGGKGKGGQGKGGQGKGGQGKGGQGKGGLRNPTPDRGGGLRNPPGREGGGLRNPPGGRDGGPLRDPPGAPGGRPGPRPGDPQPPTAHPPASGSGGGTTLRYDWAGSFGFATGPGFLLSADDSDATLDPGLRLALRYRPTNPVGLEVELAHHDSFGAFGNPRRAKTSVDGLLGLYALPRTPAILALRTDRYSVTRGAWTVDPQWGAVLALSAGAALSEVVTLEFENRGVGWIDEREEGEAIFGWFFGMNLGFNFGVESRRRR